MKPKDLSMDRGVQGATEERLNAMESHQAMMNARMNFLEKELDLLQDQIDAILRVTGI